MIQQLRIVAALTFLVSCVVQAKVVRLDLLSRFLGSGAEIGDYDACTKLAYITALDAKEILVLNMTNPSKIVQADSIAVAGIPNSVAIHEPTKTIAIASMDAELGQGYITIIAKGKTTVLEVNYGPDMVTFARNGKSIVAAIEGEVDDNDVDHPGSIAIIDVETKKIVYMGFEHLDKVRPLDLKNKDIFVTPGVKPSLDFEPEYLSVEGQYVYASLQEANAIARIDLSNLKLKARVFPLGLKDHSLPGNGIDASDEDGGFNIQNYPIFGAYMPDTIATFNLDRTRYVVMANEGDARDDVRVEDIVLNKEAFPNAEELQAPDVLGRLQVIPCGACKEYKKLIAFGARSFSIFMDMPANGGLKLVFDSGDDFERITNRLLGADFNSDHEESGGDSRSDNKGPEPEALTLGVIDGYRYAFIGLERVGGIMVYDITNPTRPRFVTYFNNRDFSVDVADCKTCDLGPESLVFIPADASPNKKPLLMVSSEVSKTTSLYSIVLEKSAPGPIPPPPSKLVCA